jgi:hypothetical protein
MGHLMAAFAEEQAARDEILARAIADGHTTVPGIADECRRWSTCDRCGWRSPEARWLIEQINTEDDHAVFGCTAVVEQEPIDIDLNLWPYPEPWTFTRTLQPLNTIHVYRPANPGFVSSRTPQARSKAA